MLGSIGLKRYTVTASRTMVEPGYDIINPSGCACGLHEHENSNARNERETKRISGLVVVSPGHTGKRSVEEGGRKWTGLEQGDKSIAKGEKRKNKKVIRTYTNGPLCGRASVQV